MAEPQAIPASALRRRLAAALLGSIALHAAAAAVLDVRGKGAGDAYGPMSTLVLRAELRRDPKAAPAAAAEPAARPAPALAQAPAPSQETPAHPLAAVPDTHYYRLTELNVRPGIKTRVDPEYPVGALGSGITGTVKLRLFIDAKGKVDRVQTLSAEPRGHFEEAAERAFRGASFTPGYRAGQAVPVQIVVEVLFEEQPLKQP